MLSSKKLSGIINCCLALFFLVTHHNIYCQYWQKVGNGINRPAVTLFADSSRLYIGEDAGTMGNNPVNYWDGSILDTLGPSCGLGPITSIEKFQNKLYIAGSCGFTMWNGNNWVLVDPAMTIGLYAYDNLLFVTGWFQTIGGITASKIAKWDGVVWSALDSTQWSGGAISCAIIYKGELYIGGNMVTSNQNGLIENLAKWDGLQWKPVGNNEMATSNGGISCFEIYQNNLYIGGLFSVAWGNPGNGITCWDGTQWLDVGGMGGTSNPHVYDLQIFNAELYASGVFYSAGGVPINEIAKWDTKQWCGLGVTTNLGNGINSMAVYNNELFIGGGFKTINGDTMNYIAKWIGGNYTDTCGVIIGQAEISNHKPQISIFSNPFNNTLTVEFETPPNSNFQFTIFNYTGKEIIIIKKKQLSIGTQHEQINTEQFTPGIYLLKANINEKILTMKIIKM